MAVRYFSLIFGIVFLLIGIAGFIPALVTAPTDAGASADGRLFGLFPINALHNLVHISFGIWGLVAYRAVSAGRTYAKSVAVIYGVLTIIGIIPGLNTTFGLVPLYGHDVWLHAALAIVAAYFGFASRSVAEDRRGMVHSGR
jgi:hypothetical protein